MGIKDKIKTEKIKNIFIWILSVFLVFAISGNILLALLLNKEQKEHEDYNELKTTEINSALNTIAQLESDIHNLNVQLDLISEEKKKGQEKEKELEANIENLQNQLDEKTNYMKVLENQIEELQKNYDIDINAQVALISDLNSILRNPPQKVDVFAPEEDEETELVPATVSVCYYNIKNGYTYSFNAEHIYYSASLVKLPYAISLLQQASKDKNDNLSVEEYDPLGLGETFIYNKSLAQEGSGIIQNGKDGDAYTYLQLVEYLMRYSDNVAFTQLREKYRFDYMSNYIDENNIRSMKANKYNLKASDGVLIMRDLYKFINSDENYGSFLEDAMCNSIHTVMTVAGVSPKKCAHKYGWDENSYHDMTLVYDENPYIIVFMSDLHQGGGEVDGYIQEVAKKIDKLHRNFYK